MCALKILVDKPEAWLLFLRKMSDKMPMELSSQHTEYHGFPSSEHLCLPASLPNVFLPQDWNRPVHILYHMLLYCKTVVNFGVFGAVWDPSSILFITKVKLGDKYS